MFVLHVFKFVCFDSTKLKEKLYNLQFFPCEGFLYSWYIYHSQYTHKIGRAEGIFGIGPDNLSGTGLVKVLQKFLKLIIIIHAQITYSYSRYMQTLVRQSPGPPGLFWSP